MNLSDVLLQHLVKLDKNGIYVSQIQSSKALETSKSAWEKIYDFDLKKLTEAQLDFKQNKLEDHLQYILNSYSFKSNTIYLEIGCGPAYIADYLLCNHNVKFIGVDFNYKMLLTLKKYFKKININPKKYLLICADISSIPIKKGSVDYIYGGGVIEHLPNTENIIASLGSLLAKRGVMFNTVPAFNLYWICRSWNNIPNVPFLRKFAEYIHLSLLNGKVLEKYYGYELSFSLPTINRIHEDLKIFSDINSGSFAFHPSSKKISLKRIRNAYFEISKSSLFCPMYYIWARK